MQNSISDAPPAKPMPLQFIDIESILAPSTIDKLA